MKALNLTNQRCGLYKSFCEQTDAMTNGQTDKRTNRRVKNYVPPIYRCGGIKSGLNAFAKSIDSGQPAQSAPADMGLNFLVLVNFLHLKGRVYVMVQLYILTEFRNTSLSLTSKYDMYRLVRNSISIPHNNRFQVCFNILWAFMSNSTF